MVDTHAPGSDSATLQVYDHVPMGESALQTLKIDVFYFLWELRVDMRSYRDEQGGVPNGKLTMNQ